MVEDLWIDGPDDIANAPDQKRRRKQRRGLLERTYAKIPHDRGLKLAKRIGNPALAVLLALEHVIHDAHSNRVKLTNGLLERYGISPQSKARGLRQLAAEGTISVASDGRRGHGGAPMVTHHWYTRRGELKGVRK
jgi:hypothetical protein